MKTYDDYIDLALQKANISIDNGDVPVGCIIVYEENKNNKYMCKIAEDAFIKNNDIVATAYNMRNKYKNTIYHAEILAINEACEKFKDYRLEECVMYITLEPCQMCAGAILQSRMKKVVIGAKNNTSGSCGSIINILQNENFNHKVDIEFLDRKDCEDILKNYFKNLRKGFYKNNGRE